MSDGSNTKTTMQQTVHETQQAFFGPRRSNHLLRRFAAGPSSSTSSIWRRASSMFGAMVRALVKECLHRCEVKVPASCSTSIAIVGRSAAARSATKFWRAGERQTTVETRSAENRASMTKPRPTGTSLYAMATRTLESPWQKKPSCKARQPKHGFTPIPGGSPQLLRLSARALRTLAS